MAPSTVRPKDRQNFESVLAICDEKVLDLLSEVGGNEGTIIYLRILSNIVRSFLDLSLQPLERLRMLWFSVFLLRIWKQFILKSKKKYSLLDFISGNCYSCIEINAHSLILLMLFLKERKLDHLFHPQLLGSQQCEHTFRQIRSFTSTYSTVTNSTLLEITRRISKIELQNQISHIKLKQRYTFPRIGLKSSSYYSRIDRNGIDQSESPIELPSRQDIINEIELAKIEAIEYAESLGMTLKNSDSLTCRFPKPKVKGQKVVERENNDLLDESSTAENNDVLKLFENVDLKPLACKKVDTSQIKETDQYVKVRNMDGQILPVKKHTLCWFLQKPETKLSNDRLTRVNTK